MGRKTQWMLQRKSSMKSWLEQNAIEMNSAHNEGKSVITERFIRILKNKIHNCNIKKCVYWKIRWNNI